MNTAQAYAILDASNYVQFTGEEGVIRLNGFFNADELEAAAFLLRNRSKTALTDEQLAHMTNKGRSRCIHCASVVTDGLCNAGCDA